MANNDFTVNVLAQARFEIVLSNLPSNGSDMIRDMDLRKYNNFVKSVNIPASTMEYIMSNTLGGSVIKPIPAFNKDMPEFSVTYALDEYMTNYWYLFDWIWTSRNAKSLDGKTWLQDAKINEAILCAKDNNGTVRNYLSFIDCYVSNISGLDLFYGQNDNLTFTVNYKFNGITMKHFGNTTGYTI